MTSKPVVVAIGGLKSAPPRSAANHARMGSELIEHSLDFELSGSAASRTN